MEKRTLRLSAIDRSGPASVVVRAHEVEQRRSSITVEIDGKPIATWTECTHPIDTTLTPWLPTLSVTALNGGRKLVWRPDEPLNARAVRGAEQARQLLTDWFPELSPAQVTPSSPTHVDRQLGNRGVGCFFSGGVDSFYSVLRHADTVTHVILIHGLDISLDNEELWDETLRRTTQAASDLGKELIVVRSDIRRLHHHHGPNWQRHAHGAFLAHVALLLAPVLERVIVPASDDETRLEPYGTHPDLDPLWSSDEVTIVHDGPHRRTRKLSLLAGSDVAMRHLRVCWWNLSTAYNCGRCEKCLRTMIGLHIVGALGRCETLPDQIDENEVRRMYLHAGGDGGRLYAIENLEDLESSDRGDTAIAIALRRALHRGPVTQTFVAARFWRQVLTDFLLMRVRQLLRRRH